MENIDYKNSYEHLQTLLNQSNKYIEELEEIIKKLYLDGLYNEKSKSLAENLFFIEAVEKGK